MNSLDQILQEAIHLPEDQRLALANRLLLLSEPHAPENLEHIWDTEIRNRIARYDAGELTSRPASEVFSDLERRLNQ